MPLCLIAPVAMPLLPSRNAPTAKSQCTHILEHRGCNAPLFDGMPHFRDGRVFFCLLNDCIILLILYVKATTLLDILAQLNAKVIY